MHLATAASAEANISFIILNKKMVGVLQNHNLSMGSLLKALYVSVISSLAYLAIAEVDTLFLSYWSFTTYETDKYQKGSPFDLLKEEVWLT